MKSISAAWRKTIAIPSIAPLAALSLLIIIAALPLGGAGLLNTRGGGDSPFLLLRTHQMAVSLRAGHFPVRWMPDAAYGLGYPFFSYYAALPYYLAAALTLIGVDILSAIKLTQVLFFIAAAWGMYGWANRVLRNRAGAWLSAVAYTFAPFHLANVYVRGDSLSEFAAFAFYPAILWGLDRLAERPTFRRTLPPALAYAGLILTHNISALIFSPFVLLYILLHVLHFTFSKTTLSRCLLLFTPILIGLLLSAWFWLPALAEMKYVQLNTQTTGYFFYGNHFRGPNQVPLVQPGLIFRYTGCPASFAMSLPQVILALIGIIVVIRHSSFVIRHSPFSILNSQFSTLSLILSTWLITPLSRPLWAHLPLLPMVQFPWRFLSVQALFAALLIGAIPGIEKPGFSKKPGFFVFAALLAATLCVTGMIGLRPEYLPIAAEDVTVERLQLYELFTDNIGSTIRNEYLPRWVEPRPHTGPPLFDPEAPPRPIPVDEGGEIVSAERIVRQPTRRVWKIEADRAGTWTAFPLHYWPGWRATVDGAPVEVKPAPDSGYITLHLPPGEHTVKIKLGRTPLRLAAELTSLITVILLSLRTVLSFKFKVSSFTFYASRFTFHVLRLTLYALPAILILLSPRLPAADATDLTMDFEARPYLHHNPDGVRFGLWRMMGYRYSADHIAPGETLSVTLEGERLSDGTRLTLRLISPASVRHDELPPLAQASAPTPDATLKLTVPPNAAPGLYLLQLTGGEETPTAEASARYLRPVWVRSSPSYSGPALETFADGALRLHNVQATQSTPDRLDVHLDWSAARPVAANYKISLRLSDSSGHEWARLDTQPGYGFLPTSLWPIDRLFRDRYALPLPAGISPGENYHLAVILYRAASSESVGEHRAAVSLERFTLRPDAPVIARFGDDLALSRLDAPVQVRQGDRLGLTAYWLALGQLDRQPAEDYVAEWRLTLGQSGAPISATSPLAPGVPPGNWPAGAWIADRSAISIPSTAPTGDYTLSLRLHAAEIGAPLGVYTHTQTVRVEGRERVWDLPPMEQEMDACFGGIIELAGYDLARESDAGHALDLTLHWRALAESDRHYMFFVHLADPETGQPVAQVDAMPRGFTYPTGLWAPGEIVSDKVTLSLKGVRAGRYDLAVGWYDPETKQRLPAFGKDGERLPDDRLLLSEDIVVP